MRCVEFIMSSSILKGIVDIKQNSLAKCKSCFWNFNLKFDLNTYLQFRVSDIGRDVH